MLPKKINKLVDMKIHEISLVTDPACPDANVLFTKHRQSGADVLFGKRDVSDEPRDDRGRWARFGATAKEHMLAVSRYAQRIGHQVIRHSGSVGGAIVSTRPAGARPIAGGGVQFEFQHRMSNGGRYHSSVQVRPEHLKNLAGTRRTIDQNGRAIHEEVPHFLQNALARTETALRHTGVGEVPTFGGAPQGQEHGFRSLFRVRQAPQTEGEKAEAAHRANVQETQDKLRRQNELRAAAGLAPSSSLFDYRGPSPTGSSGGATNSAPWAQTAPQTGGETRSGPAGIPIYRHFEAQPEWSRRAQGSPPAGSEPLPDSSYRAAGGKAHYYRGSFVPRARPDVQMGIASVHDWMAASPALAQHAKERMQERNTRSGDAFFTEKGEYVPPGNAGFQQGIKEQYAAHGRGSLFRTAEGKPLREYPDDLTKVSDNDLFNLSDKAKRLNHRDMQDQIAAEMTRRTGPRITRVAEAPRQEQSLNWGDARKSGFAPFITSGVTKSRRGSLERAQRIAKSKIKRD